MSDYPEDEQGRKKALAANEAFCKPAEVEQTETERVQNQTIKEWVEEYEYGRKK